MIYCVNNSQKISFVLWHWRTSIHWEQFYNVARSEAVVRHSLDPGGAGGSLGMVAR